MNTKEIQDQLADLRTADIAAFKAKAKTNLVLNFVRDELIKRAFNVDEKLEKEVTVNVSMVVASYIMPSLALLSRAGQYPALFESAHMAIADGDINFSYVIKADGLSNEYRNKLNEKLNINIPITAEEVVV